MSVVGTLALAGSPIVVIANEEFDTETELVAVDDVVDEPLDAGEDGIEVELWDPPVAASEAVDDGGVSDVAVGELAESEKDPGALEEPTEDDDTQQDPSQEGWLELDGKRYWIVDGEPAVGELCIDGAWYYFDPEADGAAVANRFVRIPDASFAEGFKWCWFDADGVRATGERYVDGGWYYLDPARGGARASSEFVLLDAPGLNEGAPVNAGRKWVYYGADGRMLYGEQYLDGGWYYLDPVTGAVTYGFVYLADAAAPGGAKWVWYGPAMGDGRMRYGEQYIDGGWYYLDPALGAVTYGWKTIPDGMGGVKTVWYGPHMGDGRMRYGEQLVDGTWQFFDEVTGRVLSANEKAQRVVSAARSWLGTPDSYTWRFQNEVRDCGGAYCPYGPCMSFVWHVFKQAGLSGHLADGLISGYPHSYLDWFRARGKANRTPTPGSVYFLYHGGWSANLSAGHAEVVIGSSGNVVYSIGADTGGVIVRSHYISSLVSFGHPF